MLQRNSAICRNESKSGLTTDREIDNSLEAYFSCPCGKRSISHYFERPSTCRKLKQHAQLCLPPKASDPLSHTAMNQYLEAETKILKDAYSKFELTAYSLVKANPSRVRIMQRLVRVYNSSFCSDDFEELYDELLRHTNFINFEPLQNLIDRCIQTGSNDQQLQSDSENAASMYCTEYEKYAQNRVFEIPVQYYKLNEDGQKLLCVKVEDRYDEWKLNQTGILKTTIKHIIPELREEELPVVSVTEGCVICGLKLYGLNPSFQFDLSTQQKQALASNKITLLKHGDTVVYCICHLFDNKDMVRNRTGCCVCVTL